MQRRVMELGGEIYVESVSVFQSDNRLPLLVYRTRVTICCYKDIYVHSPFPEPFRVTP